MRMLCLPGRATLTLLPEGMLEMVVKKLDLNDKVCSLPVPSCL